jgi:hypothetical protein
MKEMRILSATGILGSGFREETLKRAMQREPHFIGADSGSTDPGPHYLGSGGTLFSDSAYKRDLRLMLLAGRAAKIPVIVAHEREIADRRYRRLRRPAARAVGGSGGAVTACRLVRGSPGLLRHGVPRNDVKALSSRAGAVAAARRSRESPKTDRRLRESPQ